MPTVKELYGLSTPRRHTVTLDNTTGVNITSKDLVGIEVEVENVTAIDNISPMWMSKSDGSLRNNGAEFVSHPIAACDAPASLHSLMTETLRETSCFSPRTSVHVHLDFTNDQKSTAEDVVLLYSVFERLFFRFVGKQRIKNIYCVPLTETSLIRDMGRTGGIDTNTWRKYSALNAKPLEQFGTLEFRHMHGTFDVRKLCVWIDLITRLKTYCLKSGTKSIRETLSSMDDKYDFAKLLREIFEEQADYFKYESFEDVKFTYEVAKFALTRSIETYNLSQRISSNSPFYQLRTA